jgi:resuscitation-promoting factor RpfA
VLRFWESRFSQISPMKKGGGRRYYRREDIALLSGIRALLYDEGFSIKAVQGKIKAEGIDRIASLVPSNARPVSVIKKPAVSRKAQTNTEPSPKNPAVLPDNEAALKQQGNADASGPDTAKPRAQLSHALEQLLAARAALNETLQKH